MAAIAAIAAVFGAIIAAMAAIFTVRCQIKSQETSQERLLVQSTLLRSIEMFKGTTQNRSAGISLLEGYWDKFETSQLIAAIAVLAHQAIYLLRESKQESAAHELNNFKRIMNLLERAQGESRLRKRKKEVQVQLEDVSKNLREKFPKKDEVEPKGLSLKETDLSEKWTQRLKESRENEGKE